MNCLIYPFAASHESLVDSVNKVRRDIHITAKVVPNGIVPLVKDKDIDFVTDYDKALEENQGVIITDCCDRKGMYKEILSRIEQALSLGKTVYNCTELKEADLERLESLPCFDEERFVNYAVYPDKNSLQQDHFVAADCPVVGIGNMLRKLDDSTGLYQLKVNYTEQGFRTAIIGSRFDCCLLGGYIFPVNVYDLNILEEDKIAIINTYVNDVQLKTGADVIVIEYPDGFMRYSDEMRQGFGVRAYMASQAVKPDYFILNIPFNQVDAQMIGNLKTHFAVKFDIDVDVLAVESKMIEYGDSLESGDVCFEAVPDRFVDEEVNVLREDQDLVLAIRANDIDSYADVAGDCAAKLSGVIEEF